MTLTDYWRVLRHRWRIVLACTMIGLLLAALVTMAVPRRYEATSELFVAPDVGSTSLELAQGSDFLLDRVKSYVEVIDKDVVLGPVIEELDLDMTVREMSEAVSASVLPETVVVEISVAYGSAEGAARIANAVAEQFATSAVTLEPTRVDERPLVQITVIDPARAPESPVTPRRNLNLLLGLLVGLAGGLSAAIGREALDRRVKGENDVKGLTRVPIMGSVPDDHTAKATPVSAHAHARSTRAEALRQLRTNLQFLDVSQDRRSYVITSSVPGEGKTLTAINLAITMAEGGSRVCLLEADLRRPHIGEYLGLEGAVGLTDSLIGSIDWRVAVQEYRPRLDVLLAGTVPPNPSDLVASETMDTLLKALETRYDVVLVDAPPLLPVTDAAVLSKRCSGAIVVVGCGRKAVTRGELSRSLGMLGTVGARILGVVLNKLPQKGPHAVRINSYSYSPDVVPEATHSVPVVTGSPTGGRGDDRPQRGLRRTRDGGSDMNEGINSERAAKERISARRA